MTENANSSHSLKSLKRTADWFVGSQDTGPLERRKNWEQCKMRAGTGLLVSGGVSLASP